MVSSDKLQETTYERGGGGVSNMPTSVVVSCYIKKS